MSEIQLPVDFYVLVQGKPRHLCAVKGCRSNAAKGVRLCSGHKMAKWRAANPRRAAYCTLRDHAVRRKLSFTISFEWFCNFCNETGYDIEKGNFSSNLHIDRIDPTKGYDPDNLQALSCSENTAKGNAERWGADYRKEVLRRKGYDVPEDEDDEEIDFLAVGYLPALPDPVDENQPF